MDDEHVNLFRHTFEPNISILPVGSSSFGRAIATISDDISAVSSFIEAHVTRALAAQRNKELWTGPRSAEKHGLHFDTTCAGCAGDPKTLCGNLFRSADKELCADCHAALPDDDARAAYEEVAPMAFARATESDDDDGHLCITLPGTRRAIALLVRSAQQARLQQHDVDFCFLEEDLAVANAIGDAGDKLLCEYIELCNIINVSDDRLHTDIIGTIDAILDQETSDVGSGLILRLFAGLATRCPRWVVPSTGTSAGDLREKMTMIAELLLHSQEDAPEDDNNMEVWSFDTLISHPAFGELQLHQMVEILDKLPPPGPDEDGPLLSGTARLDEIFKVKSEPPEYTGAFKGEFSKHGTACVRSMLGQLSLDAAAEGDCTFVQPHRLPLKLTQHFHHGCGHPAPPVQLAHFILDPDMAAPGVHGMTRAADFTLRIKVMPDATMADEPSDAPSEEKSGTVVDIKDMGLFLHNRCNPSFFIEKGGSVGGAEGGVEGGDSAAESSVPVPASRLQVYAQMRVAREARRREMLEAWARARGTECTTLAELLTYYDGFLADYEKAALVCEKSTESAASAGGVAARGAPPLKAFAGLRASIIDQSIAPYVWRPGVLAGLLAADGTPAGASPLPLSPALLRRILDARPPPSADEDEKPKGADKEKGSTSADELTERLPCRESNRRRLPHRLPGRADKSHVYTEGKDVYDVLLQKSDLGADEKSYCVIQLLEAEGAPQQWYVVRQFKASLEDKPTNNTMLQTKYKHSAKKDFCEMFHELTSNEWSSREQFQPAVGKYSLVTRTHERALSPTATTETQEAASDDDDATAATGKPPASLPQLCRAAKEESALLDALRPWCASHSLDDLLHVLPALRLELVPLAELRRHVHDADGCLRASHDPRSPLRAQLADALLPGCTALRVASLDDDTPEELTCCISMELMTDPVVAMDGKSYERANINKYWERQEGRPISPITREQLGSAELYPNHNLRMVCAEFAAKHARVRMSTNDPAELVMAAILAPPTTTALDDGGAEASHRLADVYARAAGKRARKLADGADKHRADDERKRQCIAQ